MIEALVSNHTRLAPSPTLEWESVLVGGEPAEVITREAAKREVDLIVMRTRHRPYAAALLGSTAEAVCRTAHCPVLVTSSREWAAFPTGEVSLNRLLVAYDFSEDSELALAWGLSLAQEYQAELHLIHVLPPGDEPVGPGRDWRKSAADRRFQKAARLLQTAVPAEALLWRQVKQAVKEGQPYREVLRRAARIDNFMRRHRLTPLAQDAWTSLRQDLDQLARAYDVSMNWRGAAIVLR